MKERAGSLRRDIGVWGIFLNVINNTVGSGIFLLPAIVAGFLGSAAVLAYVACGILFLLVMLCYAEISSQVTCSGGTYVYIEEAFGEYAGFISNVVFWFGTGIFVTAALVNALADILSGPFPVLKEPGLRAVLFFGVITLTAIVNIRGAKQGITLIKAITIIKLLPVFLLIVVGCFNINVQNLKINQLPAFKDFGAVFLILFFTFSGGESVLNVGGEMKNPRRTAPIGLLGGLLATIVIFCAIQSVAQSTLGASLANYKGSSLAAVASTLISPSAGKMMIIASVTAILGVLFSLPLVFPRVMFAGAEKKLLPVYLAKVHPKFATPSNAIITFSVIAFFVAISGGFRQLTVIVSASMLLLYAGVILATIKLRFKKNVDKKGTFRLPFGITIHIAALLATGAFIMQLQQKELVGTALFIIVLSIIFLQKTIRNKMIPNVAITDLHVKQRDIPATYPVDRTEGNQSQEIIN